jgi:hypothetical protein
LVQTETNLPFAGVHQLLRPIRTRGNRPAARNPAIDAAFGAATTPAPELFQIGLATLELLSEAAAVTPILLIAEDAQWLDRPAANGTPLAWLHADRRQFTRLHGLAHQAAHQ